jgi:hypothetical protein
MTPAPSAVTATAANVTERPRVAPAATNESSGSDGASDNTADPTAVQSDSFAGGGDDSSDRQQGRPSPEFARFAAALAQVGGAADDGRRTHGTNVNPVPPVPSASTSAAPTPVILAPAAVAATPSDIPGDDNLSRLVQTMRVIARPGAWEATVRLKPEHLGDVTIALRVERNTVSAVVQAEAAGVRQWLETQEQAVRAGMAEHGLHLDRFVVDREGQRREANPQHGDARPRQQKPRTGAEPRFEVVV